MNDVTKQTVTNDIQKAGETHKAKTESVSKKLVEYERTVDFYLQFNNERGLKQAARLLMKQEEGLKYTAALRRVKARLAELSEGTNE